MHSFYILLSFVAVHDTIKVITFPNEKIKKVPGSPGLFKYKNINKLFSAREFRQQTKDLHIQPNDGDQETEGTIPFHIFLRSHGTSLFDHPKTEIHVHRSTIAN